MRGARKSSVGGILMRHTFIVAETQHEAWLSRRGDAYLLHLAEGSIPVAIEAAEGGGQLLRIGAEAFGVLVAADGDAVYIHIEGSTFAVRYVDPVQRYASHAGGSADDVAEAPMPGVAIAVHVKEGQRVSAGDTLMVIESMKLETAIKAWREGVVAAVHVGVGQTFQRSAPLLSLAPQSGS